MDWAKALAAVQAIILGLGGAWIQYQAEQARAELHTERARAFWQGYQTAACQGAQQGPACGTAATVLASLEAPSP